MNCNTTHYRANSSSVPGDPTLSAIAVAIALAALLVEMTHLPVRFDQPGFEMYHWLLVLFAILGLYQMQLGLYRMIMGKVATALRNSGDQAGNSSNPK